MSNLFYFGEEVKGYEVRVLNEREVRAGARILFLFAMISFFNAFLAQNYYFLKLFIITFLLDFIIRVFVNPKYSPILITGRMFVSNQKPEYSGAPQKRFAWALGVTLATLMFVLVVILKITGPINFYICLICLAMLFLETAFGICAGCKIYNLFNEEKAKLCPGGACEIIRKEEIQKISIQQIIGLVSFILTLFLVHFFELIS